MTEPKPKPGALLKLCMCMYQNAPITSTDIGSSATPTFLHKFPQSRCGLSTVINALSEARWRKHVLTSLSNDDVMHDRYNDGTLLELVLASSNSSLLSNSSAPSNSSLSSKDPLLASSTDPSTWRVKGEKTYAPMLLSYNEYPEWH